MTIADNKLIAIFMGGKTSDMNNKIVQGHQRFKIDKSDPQINF